MKKLDSIFWGVSFVLYGLVWCLIVLGVINIDYLFNGWTMIFTIIPCLLGITFGNHMLESLIGLLFSVFILFVMNGLVNFLLIAELLIPILIIIIGAYLIKSGSRK